MSLNPLGILKEKSNCGSSDNQYEFSRGIEYFPTVGDPVLLPTPLQLKLIVESGENRRINIGVSPLAGNAQVSVDPDRLFGRHLAILGNTGSGKSCSAAGVIRWSIEAAQASANKKANSRFIILDPNGEYTSAFRDMNCVRVYGVEKNDALGIRQLTVPLWLWNSAEWAAFTQASSKAQRPTLVQALRSVRDGGIEPPVSQSHSMRSFLRTIVSILSLEINSGRPWAQFPHPKNFYDKLLKWNDEFGGSESFSTEENEALAAIKAKIDELVAARPGRYPHYDFRKSEVEDLLRLVKNAHQVFGGSADDVLPIDADVPLFFTGESFLRSIEANAEMMGTTEYVETMLMRVKTLLADTKLKRIISPESVETLEQWLDEYICPSNSIDGSITVIDLSLVPAELIHIITSVVARMTLEALQRYRKINNGTTLPTTIVMEEAHTFIKKYSDDIENENASAMCTKVFEKIAREGRKFGLGLILSSQRPSELSPTVLSQCNMSMRTA